MQKLTTGKLYYGWVVVWVVFAARLVGARAIPAGRAECIGTVREVRRRSIPTFLDHPILGLGRVVPDILDFCRELVAALAEE